MKNNFNWLIMAGLFLSVSAKAETIFLPVSRHQQVQTYGLFIDQQSSLLYRSGGRAWGSVGGTIALLEESNWRWKPQLVLHGLASSSFRLNQGGDPTLLTDTIDARVGLAIDLKFTDDFRASLFWTHQSGHIADNVPDTDLIGSNLGNEIISFRLIKDVGREFRLGGSLRPNVGAIPAMKFFGADQFFEWFMGGATENRHAFTPFLAFGFEEYGLNQIDVSFHAQVGFLVGNHFDEIYSSSLRAVLGYYTGPDPRLKYYEFKNKKPSFAYAGIMIDL